jgi:hypothetical protein
MTKEEKIVTTTAKKVIIRMDLVDTVLYDHEVSTLKKLIDKLQKAKPKED